MGCVSGQTKDSNQKGSNELKPHANQSQQPLSQPAAAEQKTMTSALPQQPPPITNHSKQPEVAISSFQNSPYKQINTYQQSAAPGIHPPPAIRNQQSPIREEEILVEARDQSRLIDTDHKLVASGIVQDRNVVDGSRRVGSAVQGNLNATYQIYPQIRRVDQSAKQFVGQMRHEGQDVVHSEGIVNFAPPVRNINFHIHIG